MRMEEERIEEDKGNVKADEAANRKILNISKEFKEEPYSKRLEQLVNKDNKWPFHLNACDKLSIYY